MFQNIFQGPGTGSWTDHTIEILLMLLVAFLLGLLLGYFLWYRWRKLFLDLEAEHERLKALHRDLEKDHASLRYKLEELEKNNHDLRHKIMSLEADVAMWKGKFEKCDGDLTASLAASLSAVGASAAVGMTAQAAFSGPPPIPDDLKKIEGIGPKIEKLCNEAGIWTFAKLADTSPDFLRKMLDDAGPAYKIAEPSTWPKQAEMAAAGQWDELKEYQDFLQGGKTPTR